MNPLQVLRAAMHPNFGGGSNAGPTVTLFKHFNKLILRPIPITGCSLPGPTPIYWASTMTRTTNGADFCAVLSNSAHQEAIFLAPKWNPCRAHRTSRLFLQTRLLRRLSAVCRLLAWCCWGRPRKKDKDHALGLKRPWFWAVTSGVSVSSSCDAYRTTKIGYHSVFHRHSSGYSHVMTNRANTFALFGGLMNWKY